MLNRKTISQNILIFTLGFFAIVFIFPVFFSLMSAFKTNGEIIRNPIALPSKFRLDNFVYLWQETKFPKATLNSLFLTVVSLFFIILIMPMAAYPLARKKSKIYVFLYFYFIMVMMIPFQDYMIPLFKQLKDFGLSGTLWGPMVVYISGSCGLCILLYTSFIKTVPKELEDAARIDGCNRLVLFWRIVFPLLKPCTSSIIILIGLEIWNDFLMPLILMSGMDAKTINVEIFSFVDQYASRWDVVFAGTLVSMLPILVLFVFPQKSFVKGIT